MAWCKLEDTFRHHRKPKRLAAGLGVRRAEARGLISGLHSWCVTNAPDGHLRDLTDTEIEEAADWEGKPGEFVRWAVELELLSGEDGDRIVVGFMERAESFRKAQKSAVRRERKRNESGTRGARVEHADGTRGEQKLQRGEERRRDLISVSDSDLPPAINFEDLPRSPPATPAGRHPSVWSELAGEVERAKPLTPAAQIRRAYHEAYAKKFKREFKGWGKRENGQAAQLVGSWSLATVLELIPKFFDWNNPQVMMAGYPFGLGHASFISRIHELDADTHAPDRKRLANAVNANDRQVGNEDAEKIRYETEMRELRKGWAEPKQIAGQS
jgi:hypothetical protein